MNYRHTYHAGNFADVLKHVVLSRVLEHLKRKPSAFCVIDVHAGRGLYDLSGPEASKTGEWSDGIARVVAGEPPSDVAALLAPYLDAVARANHAGAGLTLYPGSPLIAAHALRTQDRLVANELHPEDSAALKRASAGLGRVTVLTLDAYQALKSLLPPKERRGLVLVDPPFERPDEFDRLSRAIVDGLQRFRTGVYLIWYPVKDAGAADALRASIVAAADRRFLDVRLAVSSPFPGLGLTETGLLVCNPPFTLADDLRVLLPWLSETLAQSRGAGWRLDVGNL